VRVSVVIPAYNARPALERCLRTLGRTRHQPGLSYEVIVVDDGSDDGTAELLAGFCAPFELHSVFLPRTPASGRGAARNAGIHRASGDLIVMIDADQLVTPDLLAEHVRFHRFRPDLVVIGRRDELAPGPVEDPPEVVAVDSREALYAEFSANLNNLTTCWHHLYSCNASVRREHLLAVGGFDETFRGWGLEDTELGFRLRQRGLAFAYHPGAVVYHQRPQRITARMYAEWRRNLRRFADKHRNAPEVALQSVVGRPDISWEEAMHRFEHAARALAGRLPRQVTCQVLTADDTNVDAILPRLAALAGTTDLLVIDDTTGAELSGPVQCLDTPHELLYFRRPTAAQRATILARWARPRSPVPA
jgi:glycosyltransferase involved in cell wall biosynthesis